MGKKNNLATKESKQDVQFFLPGKSVAHDAPHERKFGDDGEVPSDEELDETSTVIAGHDMIAFQE